jgi:hypothetical protein
MPPEIIMLGIALLVGAWLVLDQRSLKDKLFTILIIFALYVGYQWLSGRSISDILSQFTQFIPNLSTPANEDEDQQN